MSDVRARLDDALDAVHASAERRAFHVPGRVEVLGKHTDYGGGPSLLCAVERGFTLLAAPRADDRLRITDVRVGETVECALDPGLVPPETGWANYPLTVVRRLARNFPGALRGTEVVFASDLPVASGLSSSSALLVATYLALADVAGLEARDDFRRRVPSREALAGYLGTIENGQSFGDLAGDRGVGTFGGSEDHTAMLCARADAVVQYGYAPVRLEAVAPLPRDLVFAIAASGVVAEKTGAARERYNQLARTMAALLDAWRRLTGRTDATLRAALASAPGAASRLRAHLRGQGMAGRALLDRLEQFDEETREIIPAATRALAADDRPALGVVVDRSQHLAASSLGNQIPETVALARLARQLGAVAASAFGAGFGGSVWALVHAEEARDFTGRWLAEYRAAFPEPGARAEAFVTRAAAPAGRIA